MPVESPTATGTTRAVHHVRAELLRRIGRHWMPGERIPSIRELANTLGCSHRNTHRAVQQLVCDGVFVSRERVGVFVADKPDRAALGDVRSAGVSPHVARPLAGLRAAIFAHDLHGEAMVMRMWESFERAMAAHDVKVLRRPLRSPPPPHVKLSCGGIDAAAVFNPRSGPIEIDPGVPLVVVAQGLPNNFAVRPAANYDLVSVDHHHGGVLAGEHARRAGIKRPCFIGRRVIRNGEVTQPYDVWSEMRLDGFESGYGAPVAPADRLFSTSYSIGRAAETPRRFIELDPRPDGVFAASDDIALGFVYGATALGLTAGRDYKIVGFDGQRLGRQLDGGPLTTVNVPSEAMGEKAAELLAERMLGANQPVRRLHLGCALFKGGTM